MSTTGSNDERDLADARLLGAGDHNALVESYYGHIVRRCRARTRNEPEALEVAAEVAIRLLDELKRGRTYTVPYRVVVNKVIDWKRNEHYAPAKAKEVELGEHDAQADDPYVEFEADYDLAVLLEDLPPREYDVASLRLLEGLEPQDIADRLGIDRNTVDQAWHRAKRKLLEKLDEY
jgi:RNA polymerase sigma factor (sigma-70 family)